MAIEFQAYEVISAYRLRLRFSNELAVGAFATAWFTLISLDSLGADPVVTEAMVVPNYPNKVELTLDPKMVEGALYQLDVAAGVPATDASTSGSASARVNMPSTRKGPVQGIEAADAQVFQRDLDHDGKDFVEDPNGDLASVTGVENAQRAATRRMLSNGFPWNASFGAHPRQYVDSPTATRQLLRFDVARAAVQDDRVAKAVIHEIQDSDDGDGDVEVDATITFIDDVPRKLNTGGIV